MIIVFGTFTIEDNYGNVIGEGSRNHRYKAGDEARSVLYVIHRDTIGRADTT